jgi:hypothetical protein
MGLGIGTMLMDIFNEDNATEDETVIDTDDTEGHDHLIFTDQEEWATDVEGEAFIVHSFSPEPPVFRTGGSYTNPYFYFYDENGQPDESFKGVLVIDFVSDGETSVVGTLVYDPSDFTSVTDRVYPIAPFNNPI